MISFVIFNERTIEILDRTVMFEPGEKLFIEEGNNKSSYTITSITKVLQCNGDKCDVVQEIHIT